MAGAGVIGIAMGLAVLLSYGWGRNAFPDFSGDEWVPQLARIGMFCSVMVMLLMAVPVLDVLAQQPIVRASTPRAAPWRWGGLLRVLAHTAVGIVFLAMVALISEPGVRLLSMIVLLIFAVLLYVEIEFVWGEVRWPSAWGERLEVVWFASGGQLLYLMLLLTLWLIADRRFQQAGGLGSWLLLLVVIVLVSVYRSAFLSVYTIGSSDLKRVGAAILSVIVAVLFAPEIVRMAGVANLPHTRLLLERHTACEVARHLALTEEGVVVECAKSSVDVMQAQISLDADVVSRVGGQYVLTAPGGLLSVTRGECDFTHSMRAERGVVAGELPRLRCVDIPRDAVKAVLR